MMHHVSTLYFYVSVQHLYQSQDMGYKIKYIIFRMTETQSSIFVPTFYQHHDQVHFQLQSLYNVCVSLVAPTATSVRFSLVWSVSPNFTGRQIIGIKPSALSGNHFHHTPYFTGFAAIRDLSYGYEIQIHSASWNQFGIQISRASLT